MKEAMKKFEEAMDEMMSLCKRAVGEVMFDCNEVDPDGLRAMQAAFKLADASAKLMKEQNNLLIEMNDKLDALMKK
jgi:hypothetical protein